MSASGNALFSEETEQLLGERWLEWTRENLQRGCDPEGVVQLLRRARFSWPAIRAAMGEKFPPRFLSPEGVAFEGSVPQSAESGFAAVSISNGGHSGGMPNAASAESEAPTAMVSQKTIFVQIASYRDDECQWTVKDLFEKAKRPERINVGVCWQYDPYEDRDCFTVCIRPEQVRMVLYHWKESQGVCWARRQAQQLWRGEDYVLMVDSHMRFAQDWDEKAIRQLEECPSPKSILTNHPAAYTPPDNLDLRSLPTVMRPKPFTSLGALRFHGVFLDRLPEKPLRGAFIAAGFLFAPSQVIREVPYDPYMYFDQEEVSLAARLFTHGFDAYSPKDILAYHYYHCQQQEKKRPLHWGDNRDWGGLQKRAAKRLDHLLGFAISDEPDVLCELELYGLGDSRTLAEYEAFCGIDFKRRQVSERALRCEFIDNLSKYKKTPLALPAPDPDPALKCLASPPSSDADPREAFAKIYSLGGWVSDESVSGPGSSVSATTAIRRELPNIIQRFGVRSMLDVGCGDFNWLKEMALDLDRCIGADIVPELIDWNKSNRSGPGREFIVLDICSEPLPLGIDLILCRDCLVHLANQRVLAALQNIVNSGAKFLLATTFAGRGPQPDIRTGLWRPLDLQAEPFLLPEPLILVSEQRQEENGRYADKSLGLWECDKIKLTRFEP